VAASGNAGEGTAGGGTKRPFVLPIRAAFCIDPLAPTASCMLWSRLCHWLGRWQRYVGCQRPGHGERALGGHVGRKVHLAHGGHRFEPGTLQPALDRRLLHKHVPNTARPGVLQHEHQGPLVNAQVIGGEPLLTGVEGVFEPVGPPELRPIGGVHVPQGGHRSVGRKRQRAPGVGGREGPIVRVRGWRPAGPVPRGRIRSRQAPDIVAIRRPPQRIGNSIGPIGQRGPAGVLKIIEPLVPHIGVLTMAKAIQTWEY
jgi:hypothetical protein